MLRYLGTGTRQYGIRPFRTGTRNHWEFQTVLSGTIAPTYESALPLLRSRTLWVFPPRFAHGWTGDGDRAAEVAVFHFGTVSEPLKRIVTSRGHLSVSLLDEDLVRLRGFADLALSCLRSPTALNELHYQRILVELSLLALRELPAELLGDPPPNQTAQRVDDAVTWFREHLAERPSVGRVAKAIGVSPSYLRQMFHAVHGCCPEEALTDVRFERAHELLLEGELNLERVAELCGSASASAFSHAFKRHFGMSPAEWRAQRLPKHGTGI